jgi:hypothetical protein
VTFVQLLSSHERPDAPFAHQIDMLDGAGEVLRAV